MLQVNQNAQYQVNQNAQNQVNLQTRNWKEICIETLTPVEFKERFQVERLPVVANAMKINEVTQKPNLFFTFGHDENGDTRTGAVSQAIQEKMKAEYPVFSLIRRPDGSEVWTMHEQNANLVFSI